ncbi:MAG: hypothetical protein KC613_27265, partial [Myxococcales bacterium]|nr:hypothetical protein [Myxococcales bacterium]
MAPCNGGRLRGVGPLGQSLRNHARPLEDAMPTRAPVAALAVLALAFTGCQEYAEPTLTPAQQKKVQAHLLTAAPQPQHPVGAVFGDQVKLVGYDLDKAQVKPGDTLTVTWYLEGLAEPMGDNMPFVH